VRIQFCIGVLALAGCAGQPSSPPPTPAPADRVVAVTSQDDLDAKRLADAKKQGYKLVNNNGETLYCRTDLKTGSHVITQTTCLTAAQLDALHDQTRQSMQNQIKPLAPPQGK